jgi:hypothetical protein
MDSKEEMNREDFVLRIMNAPRDSDPISIIRVLPCFSMSYKKGAGASAGF